MTAPDTRSAAQIAADNAFAGTDNAVVAEAVPVQAAHSQPPTVPMGPETVKARVKQLEAIGEARTEAESRELYEIRPQIV